MSAWVDESSEQIMGTITDMAATITNMPATKMTTTTIHTLMVACNSRLTLPI